MSAGKTLNDGPVSRALWSVSAPMSIGILGVLSVGLADAFFLARDGATSLAAIGFVFPVTTALTSLSIGLSAGTNTVISQAIGRGENAEDRRRMTLHAMALALGLSCALALIVYRLAPYLFGAMGAEGDVLSAVLGYIRFWCISFPFLVTSMALNAVFRAGGRSGVAAMAMLALSSGIGPVVGQAWGAGDEGRARAGLRLAHIACAGIGLGVALFLTFFAGPVAALMTSGSEAQAYTATYLRVASWGYLGFGILITANAAMNARDRALWSMIVSGARIFVLYVPMTYAGVLIGGYSGMIIGALSANLLSAWLALIAVHGVGLGVIGWAPVRLPAEWLAARLGAQGSPARD